jgi:hypothetical protein
MLPAQPATNDKDWGWQSGSSGNSACLAWVLIMAQPFKQMKDGVCSNLRGSVPCMAWVKMIVKIS